MSGDEHFYPRSPCGERPNTSPGPKSMTPISIHALLAESDRSKTLSRQSPNRFLSTLSLRRATPFLRSGRMTRPYFYPRSPCGERPHNTDWRGCHRPDFYPRSPCGERQPRQTRHCKKLRFLSTLSLRRATIATKYSWGGFSISIHALLAESDVWSTQARAPDGNFYPRSPCGERPSKLHKILADWDFYPRSPCGERHFRLKRGSGLCKFLSTLSLRRATSYC